MGNSQSEAADKKINTKKTPTEVPLRKALHPQPVAAQQSAREDCVCSDQLPGINVTVYYEKGCRLEKRATML